MLTSQFDLHLSLVKRFFVNLGRDFLDNGCQKSAAALTYMTLFAIVPSMTVIYSVFSVIPAFNGVADKLQMLLFSHFIPETGQELQVYLNSFSEQARNLTGFGVGMLVVTAYLMLTNIEKTFNQIWGVDKPRRGLSSFLLYWAVLSLGPLLLGVGLAMNTYLLSLKIFVDEFDTWGIATLFFAVFPWLMTSAAFTLLFAAVPNCRVPIKFAVIGGLITALCFEALKIGFSSVVANSNFQLVYGAFAAVPLFLMWINLLWTVVLSGAILVRTLSDKQYINHEGKVTDMVAALKVLNLMLERSQVGGKVSDGDCYRLGLGVVHWQLLRGQLIKSKWISVTSSGSYVLCRDLRSVSLFGLARLLKFQISDLDAKIARPPNAAWFERYLAARAQVLNSAQDYMSLSVEALLMGDGVTDKASDTIAEARALELSVQTEQTESSADEPHKGDSLPSSLSK